jgi:hypothetical protein
MDDLAIRMKHGLRPDTSFKGADIVRLHDQ